jgi:hypothetical protein
MYTPVCIIALILIYAQTRDENVTIVTKFPFAGGSLGGKRDLLEHHADSLLQPHFLRSQGILVVDE